MSLMPDSGGAMPAQPVTTSSQSLGGFSLARLKTAFTGFTSKPVNSLALNNSNAQSVRRHSLYHVHTMFSTVWSGNVTLRSVSRLPGR